MKKLLLLFAFCSLCITAAMAQYRVEVNISGAEDSMVYLNRYAGDEKVAVDSIRANKKGVAVFASKNKVLAGGIYLIATCTTIEVEFVVSGNKGFEVGITANTLNVDKSLKYTKSKENEDFQKYINYYRALDARATAIQQEFSDFSTNEKSMRTLQAKFEELRKEEAKFSIDIRNANKGTLLESLITLSVEPSFQPSPVAEDCSNPDSARWVEFVAFAKEHYFDNLNFGDARLASTPVLATRLANFFQRIMLREPADEIIASANKLLDSTRNTKDLYAYILNWLYTRYNDSPIEGHHVVGKLMTDYMADETMVDWLTDKEKSVLKRNLKRYSLNPIGGVAADMMLQTADGEFKSLHTTKASYTLLYFFNPGCGSCRQMTPIVYELLQRYKDKGLKVFAVFPDRDREAWTTYIEENNYHDFINVWDADSTSNIYENYSLHAIPQIYILDENKKVLKKDVSAEVLQMFLDEIFPSRVGTIAPDLTLETLDGKSKSLYEVTAPYTVLYFYDPADISCINVTPAVYEILQRHKAQGLQVLAVYTGKDKKAWAQHIKEKKYQDFINVWDAKGTADVYNKYDVSALPRIYVLDEKKIVWEELSSDERLGGILHVAFLNVK